MSFMLVELWRHFLRNLTYTTGVKFSIIALYMTISELACLTTGLEKE